MTFSEQLNKYIKEFGCSSKELVEASGVSSAVISRYRSGERTPNIKSLQLDQLANGLAKISKEKNINIHKDIIYKSLSVSLGDVFIDFEELSKNFNEIISTLNISIAKLSRAIDFDASFLSKIRTGNRNPSNPQEFIDAVCNFVIIRYKSINEKKLVSELIECPLEDLSTDSIYFNKLRTWFSTNSMPSHNYINDFLKSLDEFDLNEYIKAVHFDELKVHSMPFQLPASKNYYGIEELKKGELDFFKLTVLSKSKEPVFMCSDMPMEDMAKDLDFGKKWMFAIAMTLKKDLHLHIIHNLDRSFNEMMLGLESWIPIYMTGQVSPYYLKGLQNSVYCHLNYVSGGGALSGECIKNSHDKGKYILTNNKEELAYYREKANSLLKIANPLMDIYTKELSNIYNAFISANVKTQDNRHNILSSPPFATISEDILKKILKRNSINDNDTIKILNFRVKQKEIIRDILKQNIVLDEYVELSKEELEKYPVSLSLSDLFYEKRILYTYDEYLEHLNMTKKFSTEYKNYKIKINNNIAFRNIQISILENNWVMISKNTSPSIHFVIKHPKLRTAIENFIAPVVE